jgi:glucoamylase
VRFEVLRGARHGGFGRPAWIAAATAAAAVAVAGIAGIAVLAQAAADPPPARSPHASIVLASGSQLVVGGRSGRAAADSAEVQTWLAQGVVPDPRSPYASLATTALSDLHSLTLHNGGVVASLPTSWHYVWPRDSSFAAVAFARTGHLPDAIRALQFLQLVQSTDGSFQARYLDDGSGPPDGRGIQEDGPGWALWAVDEVIAAAPPEQRVTIARTLQPMVDRSLHRLLDRTAGVTALPAPSSDYWETSESQLTLGIAAPTLIGLTAGSRLVQARDPALAKLATERATRLRSSIQVVFGPAYSRYAGGPGPDSAVTFLLPPYLDGPLTGAVESAKAAIPKLRQPGGGLTPGATWHRGDGVSWTPETALFMLASAETGDAATATSLLSWFAAHTKASHTIPEKVLADGSSGAVAPLAWSDALVLLTLQQLDLLGPSA